MEVQIVPEEIKLQVPVKLAQFIDKLTEEGYFNSREDFARSSIEILAQLYGLSKTSSGGKALLDVLADNQAAKAMPTKKIEEEKRPISKQEAPKVAAKHGIHLLQFDPEQVLHPHSDPCFFQDFAAEGILESFTPLDAAARQSPDNAGPEHVMRQQDLIAVVQYNAGHTKQEFIAKKPHQAPAPCFRDQFPQYR